MRVSAGPLQIQCPYVMLFVVDRHGNVLAVRRESNNSSRAVTGDVQWCFEPLAIDPHERPRGIRASQMPEHTRASRSARRHSTHRRPSPSGHHGPSVTGSPCTCRSIEIEPYRDRHSLRRDVDQIAGVDVVGIRGAVE